MSLFESNLVHFSANVQKSVQKFFKNRIWGDLVDGRIYQLPSNLTFLNFREFHNYNFMV